MHENVSGRLYNLQSFKLWEGLTFKVNFFFFLSLFPFFFFFSQDRDSLCSPGFPGTHFVEQAVLLFRDGPASASLSVGLKVWATMFGFNFSFLKKEITNKKF